MAASILTLNAGSSSLKFALFDDDFSLAPTARGVIEDVTGQPHLTARDASGRTVIDQTLAADPDHAFDNALHALLDFSDGHLGRDGLAGVGHRVVHGGARHIAPERITPDILRALEDLTPLDPLHIPLNLAPMRAVAAKRPDLPQVACFDTAFHDTMPDVAKRVAVPRAVADKGVRRYGFHGLSYEFITGELRRIAPRLTSGRVVVAHLGSGASLCAMKEGRSIETTMGFSSLDGLVMATRGGRIDPGVLLYLGREGKSFSEIEDMLYHKSGLIGVSGISGDVRKLLSSDDPHAGEAIDLFTYRIAYETGGLVSALGGLDGFVFTAGIGEHAAAIRAKVCERLGWLGLELDPAANEKHAAIISTQGSRIEVRVIPTDEETMIARHTRAVIGAF